MDYQDVINITNSDIIYLIIIHKVEFRVTLIDVKIHQILNRTQVLSLMLKALSLPHKYEVQEFFEVFTWILIAESYSC